MSQEHFTWRSLKGWDTRRRNQSEKMVLDDHFWFEKELLDRNERLSTHVSLTRDSDDFHIHGSKETRYEVIAISGRKRVFNELIETDCNGYASLDFKDSLGKDAKPVRFKINLDGEPVTVDENFHAQVGVTPVRLKNGNLKLKIQNIDYVTGTSAHIVVTRENNNKGKMELFDANINSLRPGQIKTLEQTFGSDRKLTVWVEGNLTVEIN